MIRSLPAASNAAPGFTLVELVMGLVILSVAIATLVGVTANIMNRVVLPAIVNTSTHLAEEQMERVTGLRFSDIANEGPVSFTGNFSSYKYQINVDPVPVGLANDPGMTQYKQVKITVSHSIAGSVSLTTMSANN